MHQAAERWPSRHRCAQTGFAARGGIGEGLAVMLSVVVFGLGVAALVAREELRTPMPGLAIEVTRHAHPSSSPLEPLVRSPVRGVAR